MFLLILSYIADLIFGDPEWFPHPVRGMGRLIKLLDSRLRGKNGKWIERIKGMILALFVAGTSSFLAHLFIELSRKLSPFLGSLAWIYLGYTTLSIKDLQVKAKKILKEIERGSIVEARKELSKIVGRDTQDLDKERIVVATVESIAESTNDGIVAPLFYLILGGPVLAMAYKSINTLDSMIGHRNKEYLHFGWFSARLDDIVNFIPARISGSLISVSSLIIGKRFGESFKTMLRDGKKHPSPNSGISEAAMAGALGIRLGGTWSYQGKVFAKPCLGEARWAIKPFLLNEALIISFATSIIMVLIGVLSKWII